MDAERRSTHIPRNCLHKAQNMHSLIGPICFCCFLIIMEALAVVGAVAAGVSLGAEILRLSNLLRKMVRKIRYAPRDIMKLMTEMEVFSGIYEDFYTICISDRRGRRLSTKRLETWCKNVISSGKELVERVRVLAGCSQESKIKKVAAHLKWYLSGHEVKYLRSSLNLARESMTAFSNLQIIEKLREEIKILRAIVTPRERQVKEAQLGMSVEKRLKVLKQMKRLSSIRHHRREQRHVIDRRLQELKHEIIEYDKNVHLTAALALPKAEQLFEFTRIVEQHIEDSLPAQRSGTRRRRRSHNTVAERQQPSQVNSSNSRVSTTSTSLAARSSSHGTSRSSMSPLTPMTPIDIRKGISNFCSRCSGTCLRPEEHGFAKISSDPPEASEHTFRPVVQEPTNDTEAVVGEIRESRVDTDSLRNEAHNERSHDDTTCKCPIHEKPKCLCREKSWAKGQEPANHTATVVTETQESPVISVLSQNEVNSDYGDTSEYDNEPEQSTKPEPPSPFHPVGGFTGRYPPGLRLRRERPESPQDFW
ncbi:hypothetical protein GQ44DRAFT_756164 [Phaeosphaeriaceae sp. PMI808]|nr:hypothetical protein GQ44DRAFT_756164 [Phaeosphaeriaceae sp. PMI808]